MKKMILLVISKLDPIPLRLRRPTLKLENAGHRSEKTGEYNKFVVSNLCTQNPVRILSCPGALLRLGSQFLGIFLISLALLISVSAGTLSYSVILQYDLGNFSLKDIKLVGTASPGEATEGRYTAKIISYNGETLYSTSFNMDLERYYALPVNRGTSQKIASQAKTSVNLLLPYYPNAQKIVISKGKDELLRIDVSRYAACNQNGMCEGLETPDVCPKDCTCGNKVCETTENYMSCSSDCVPEQKGDVGLGPNGAVYLIIAVCLVIVGFIILRKKK